MVRLRFSHLTVLIALVVVGTGVYQWRAMVLSEMNVAQRNSKHFETLYRDTLDEATQWRDKYDRGQKKLTKLEVEVEDLRQGEIWRDTSLGGLPPAHTTELNRQ